MAVTKRVFFIIFLIAVFLLLITFSLAHAQSYLFDHFDSTGLSGIWEQTDGDSTAFELVDSKLSVTNVASGTLEGVWRFVRFRAEFVASQDFLIEIALEYDRSSAYKQFSVDLLNGYSDTVLHLRVWDSPSHWILIGPECNEENPGDYEPAEIRIFRETDVLSVYLDDSLYYMCNVPTPVSHIMLSFADFNDSMTPVRLDSVLCIAAQGGGLNPSNGHYYEIIPIPTDFTWHQSRDSCIALGGYLATVTDRTEQDFIYSLILSVNSQDCWLGGTDEESEGVWKWVSGEPFVYTNWQLGEPNNHFGGEHYIQTHVNLLGEWNDARNWFVQPGHFIVEWDSLPCCIGTRGDLNADGDDANILDLTHLVDFIFRGSGNPGGCPSESDVNGDGGSADILDLTYLVDFIFRGGPVPPECN